MARRNSSPPTDIVVALCCVSFASWHCSDRQILTPGANEGLRGAAFIVEHVAGEPTVEFARQGASLALELDPNDRVIFLGYQTELSELRLGEDALSPRPDAPTRAFPIPDYVSVANVGADGKAEVFEPALEVPETVRNIRLQDFEVSECFAQRGCYSSAPAHLDVAGQRFCHLPCPTFSEPDPPEPVFPPVLLPCEDGWVEKHAPNTPPHCAPLFADPPSCSAGESLFPRGCRRVGSTCPRDGEWNATLPEDAIHVRPGGRDGALGTRDDPIGTVAEALLSAEGRYRTIALSVGEHEVPLLARSTLRLAGACAERTIIRSPASHAFHVTEHLQLSDVRLEGTGIALEAGSAGEIRDVIFAGANGAHTVDINRASAEISSSKFEDVERAILMSDGSLTLDSVVFERLGLAGVESKRDARLFVENSAITNSPEAIAFNIFEGVSAELEDVALADVLEGIVSFSEETVILNRAFFARLVALWGGKGRIRATDIFAEDGTIRQEGDLDLSRARFDAVALQVDDSSLRLSDVLAFNSSIAAQRGHLIVERFDGTATGLRGVSSEVYLADVKLVGSGLDMSGGSVHASRIEASGAAIALAIFDAAFVGTDLSIRDGRDGLAWSADASLERVAFADLEGLILVPALRPSLAMSHVTIRDRTRAGPQSAFTFSDAFGRTSVDHFVIETLRPAALYILPASPTDALKLSDGRISGENVAVEITGPDAVTLLREMLDRVEIFGTIFVSE